MQTILTENPLMAAEFIKAGGLVAFPTETVYGLGADVFNEAAVAKIFRAKNRPADNPLIAHISSLEQIEKLASEINSDAAKFIEAFFPSPLTLVLPKRKEVPLIATANLETIGIRMPNHLLALEFLRECGVPVVAPSANLSGRPSPTEWEAVYEDLNSRIDCILKGAKTIVGLESTIVDCSHNVPLMLRAGAISIEELRKVVPQTEMYNTEKSGLIRSPGMHHKHYSPRATVKIFFDSSDNIPENSAFIGLKKMGNLFRVERICKTPRDYAHELFSFFRECDANEIGNIYCEAIAEEGIGVALMDRIRRAADD